MPLGRGKSGKEALRCLRPPADTQHAACPAAWEVLFHTMPPHPACRAHIRTLQGETRLTAHRHRLTFCGKRSSGHAASPAAREAPFHTVTARPPACQACIRTPRGSPAHFPPTPAHPFKVSYPVSTPPVTPHGSTFLACAFPHPPTHQAEPPPHRRSCRPIPRTAKNRTHPRACPVFYGIRRGYALAERI